MQVTLVITILGEDKPGLVESISTVLNDANGNWTDSRMVHLAGKFAGLLQITLAEDKVEEFKSRLLELQSGQLKIAIESASENYVDPVKTINLELLGQDRPGIIRDITRELAKLHVNIEELDSEIRQASMSGETLFCANLKLGLPNDVSTDVVKDMLEEMSDQFMVDVNFND